MAEGIPHIAGTAAELVAGATDRVDVDPGDGKSGSSFSTLQIDGERYFLKSVSPGRDWLMRVTGDREHRTFRIWEAGIMDATPPGIDHAVVGMALEDDGDDPVLSILMRDVGAHLVPEGDDLVPAAQHAGFVAHLAELSAAWWGWHDDLGLTPLAHRFRFFAPDNIAAELAVPDVPGPIAAADEGWRRLPARDPGLAARCVAVHDDPEPLAAALAATPGCFLHGDWKAGNLGSHPDGRTILLDWAYPGEGPCCWDLAWYLALNRARLPESKEATIERFRDALEGCGIATSGWFEEQLDLSMLAIMACFGWEKALGPDDELAWWSARAEAGARRLGG